MPRASAEIHIGGDMTITMYQRFAVFALALAAVIFTCCATLCASEKSEFPPYIPFAISIEGVAVDKTGNVYVSVRDVDAGRIWKFAPDGQGTPFATIGTGVSMVGGLALDAEGNLFVAVAEGPDRGVYSIDRRGDSARLPGTEQIAFANALAFDQRGNLYVTESYSGSVPSYGPGGIWRIPSKTKTAELWQRDALFTGLGYVLGYPVGANGIAIYHGDLYVVNTDKGIVVRVSISADGNPGIPEVWAPLQEVPESPMAGSPFPLMGDGLALDVHGNVFVAVISRSAIVRINASDKSQETVSFLPIKPLDCPASLAFGTGTGEQQNLFVTNLGWMSVIVPGRPWPGPGLVMIDAGVPGLPLP
jgi:sugar lactone lactonase YvrE